VGALGAAQEGREEGGEHLAAVALIASHLSAHRATLIDPMTAIRAE
jgi:hypothetical protein